MHVLPVKTHDWKLHVPKLPKEVVIPETSLAHGKIDWHSAALLMCHTLHKYVNMMHDQRAAQAKMCVPWGQLFWFTNKKVMYA